MLTIYTKDNCTFCVQTKTLLNQLGIAYEEKKLDKDFTCEVLLESFPSARSFPVIVNGDQVIGGYVQLVEQINSGNTFGKMQLNG